MGTPWVAKGPMFLQIVIRSDCADVQTVLNLCFTHMPTCTLCRIPAHFMRKIMFVVFLVIGYYYVLSSCL